MSGYWNGLEWVDTTRTEASAQPETVDLPPAQQWIGSASNQQQETTMTNEVNIEDQTMLQAFFAKLASKVVEASDLAKRVSELEFQLQAAANDITNLRNELSAERVNHAGTSRQLEDIRQKLEHEQRAVHDLVMERDIVIEERNKAQNERNDTGADRDYWKSTAHDAESRCDEQREVNRVLEERCNLLTQRLAAFKAAFAGLSDL